MGDFARPKEGFRFRFLGMKTNSSPDSMPEGKYPLAINVRAYSDNSIRTRPGTTKLFGVASGSPDMYFTDLRAYSALLTDNLPRILGRTANDSIYLDTSVKVGTLAGGGASQGASMIPFRPGASPTPFMYIANGSDYQKFSAPSATNVVTQQKVGIAEPQTPPDMAVQYTGFPTPGFVLGGVLVGFTGATFPARVTDTVGAVLSNPNAPATMVTLQVTSAQSYQKLMIIGSVNGIGQGVIVLDVFPPLLNILNIASIFYFTGTTGRCIIVPSNLAAGAGVDGASVNLAEYLSVLREGALIKVGTEVCLVWSVSSGLNNTISIETSTINPHTIADTLTGVPAIQVLNPGIAPGSTLSSGSVSAGIAGAGIATATTTISINPFVAGGASLQADDYITFGVKIDNLDNLNEIRILFDVDDGTFTKNFYYYAIRPSDLANSANSIVTQLSGLQELIQRSIIDEEIAAATNNQQSTTTSSQTVAGTSQWTQVSLTIRELTKIGGDDSKTLQNLTKIQLLFNASGALTVGFDSVGNTMGGNQPDVGDIGAPYLYRVRPRSKVTGTIGNPSPATRYGVNPRRNLVLLNLPSAAYDPQIDTWDIFRYGGAITSWRYVGSTPSSNSQFQDNYSDDAVGAGDELEFDNFEPWPIIDIPNNGTASIVNGTIAIISTVDSDVVSYLPGTLVQLGGINAYTLRVRPVSLGGNNYRLEFLENAGAATNISYNIQEPLIANGKLPYMWGPDVSGTVFAVGDTLNPGKLYFSKNYAPDSAPDSYNVEITQPSEPLLGGEVVDGLGFVASTERWWALYPQPSNPAQRYNFVEQPVTRGLAAPFGHCTDHKEIFYWAKDGIYGTQRGSLTDADLYNLFPHDGVEGQQVSYNGINIIPPDYSQVTKFRLAYSNGYLYATYANLGGTFSCLVLDLKHMAWNVDQYPTGPSVFYKIEQQVESAVALNPVLLLAYQPNPIFSAGSVFKQTDLSNDAVSPGLPRGVISSTLAMREFDGGDIRAPKQWGDFFLDLIPAATGGSGGGVTATPMSLSAGITAPTTIPTGASRTRIPVSVGGTLVSDFLGLLLQWTDDLTLQTVPTQLIAWQPSFDVQPARTISWKTFGTSFGLQGFGHVQHVALAYVSTAPITLQMTTFDGQSPAPITIPSSGGQYQKALFSFTANKGQLFTFQATSTAPFQIFEEDLEIHVGAWSRQGPYAIMKSFGGSPDAASPI